MSATVSTRPEKELDEDVRLIMAVERLDRAKALRRLLEIGGRKWRIEYALRLLADGRATVQKAAEIARVPLWEMIYIIKEGKVVLPISVDEVVEDIRAALREG